jgi:ATP-dependent Lhr-like helicase
MVVVDEWHELLGNKRGVQLQLALARLRRWHPELIVWGVSATLGNQVHAEQVLIPQGRGISIQGQTGKKLLIDTLLPPTSERFPWAGHIGLKMLPQVAAQLDCSASSLVFTNTRAQSEIWYQALLDARPEWAGLIALHHSSLSRETRNWVERALKEGRLKVVVCTSSLDLGVDFLPVERVLQIGSAKGVARLMQRAGRSGHAPGRVSRVTLVPTHNLELIEAAAAQDAVAQRRIEPRESPDKPLDVLVQHLVSMALGGGFDPDELYEEVRGAWAYRDLSPADWTWALAFVRHGGLSLTAYPDYRRVEPDEQGVWRVPDARLARRHRMSIGTIVSDASIQLKFWSKGGGGKQLGSVEEGFIARLKPGDCIRQAQHTEKSRCAPLEWWAHASFQRAGQCRGCAVQRCGTRHIYRPGNAGIATANSRATTLVRIANRTQSAGRNAEISRRLASFPLSLRWPSGAFGVGEPVGVASQPAAIGDIFHRRQ